MRKYRKTGVGRIVAHKLFAEFPGRWHVEQEVVAVLQEIKPVDMAAADKEVASMQSSLSSTIAADLFEQFSAALRRDITVTKDQAAVDALYQ